MAAHSHGRQGDGLATGERFATDGKHELAGAVGLARLVALVAGAVVMLGGLSSLSGWIFSIPRLTDWDNDGITIKANATIALTAAGFGLLSQVLMPRLQWLARGLGGLVMVMGGLTLLQHGTGANFGIDTLLFHETLGAKATSSPGRMGVPASTCFTLLGFSLVAATLSPSWKRIAAATSPIGMLIALLPVIGYVYGADQLFTLARYTGIALQTAVLLLVLSVGVTASVSEFGLAKALARDDIGGITFRRLVVPFVILPIALGWLRVLGQKAGLYDTALGSAILSVVTVTLLVGMLWWTSLGISRAAAEARDATQALRESEMRFRLMADSAPVLTWMSGTDGGYTWSSKPWLEFTGRRPADEVGQGWIDGVHPADREALGRARSAALAERRPYLVEFRLRRHDGEYRWLLDNGVPRYDPNGDFVGFIGSCVDISDLKQSEEALRESNARHLLALEAGKMGAWEWNVGSNEVNWSRELEAIHGLEPGSFPGTFEAYQKDMHPHDRQRVLDAVTQSLHAAQDHHVEYRIIWPDGSLHWVEGRGKVITDDEGKPLRLVGVCTDITERKNAEEALRALAATLEEKVNERTAELLSANEQLQGFTYSVAHDLRQQIRGISTNASLVLHDASPLLDEESRGHLQRLVGSAKQLSALVDDLLQYAKLGREEPRREHVDLSEMAHRIAEALTSQTPSRATVEIDPGLQAKGDPSMIGIALQNLLDNAIKYSNNAEAARVRVGRDDRGFFVQDNGIGFDMAFANRIFEPFERLHRGNGYAGTGIGLANVRRIVEKHGGQVWAESAPGEGSKFYFTLP